VTLSDRAAALSREIRERHEHSTIPGAVHCRTCCYDWPCSAIRAADLIDEFVREVEEWKHWLWEAEEQIDE
jgi:hypothetical protein